MKIISGGQTGADRAAWDAALEAEIEIGGFVPRGRWAEDGPIPLLYPGLTETETADPAERTGLNIMSSDATLIFSHGAPSGGTGYTMQLAEEDTKPFFHIDLSTISRDEAVEKAADWLGSNCIGVLNVAGARASEDAAIYYPTIEILRQLFLKIKKKNGAKAAPFS